MSIEFFWRDALDTDALAEWSEFLSRAASAHPFQEPAWGEIMRAVAYTPCFVVGRADAQMVFAALVLTHRVRGIGRERWLIPRGPVCDDLRVLDAGMEFLEAQGRRRGVMLGVVNPYWRDARALEELLAARGWSAATDASGMHSVSLEIDLCPPLDQILRAFRQTTRHEITRAERAGAATRVAVDESELRAWFEIYRAQMTRRGLDHSAWGFFRAWWDAWLANQSGGALILAEHADRIGAGAVILKHNHRAWYTYAAATRASGLSLGHLVLWRAIQWARENGCEVFDLGGWAEQPRRDDPVYGVSLFKAGFSKSRVQFPREHTRIFAPRVYRVYRALNRVRAWVGQIANLSNRD